MNYLETGEIINLESMNKKAKLWWMKREMFGERRHIWKNFPCSLEDDRKQEKCQVVIYRGLGVGPTLLNC